MPSILCFGAQKGRVACDPDGEEQLVALTGKKLMQPLKPAYAPASDSLEWRFQRLNLVVCAQIGMPT